MLDQRAIDHTFHSVFQNIVKGLEFLSEKAIQAVDAIGDFLVHTVLGGSLDKLLSPVTLGAAGGALSALNPLRLFGDDPSSGVTPFNDKFQLSLGAHVPAPSKAMELTKTNEAPLTGAASHAPTSRNEHFAALLQANHFTSPLQFKTQEAGIGGELPFPQPGMAAMGMLKRAGALGLG